MTVVSSQLLSDLLAPVSDHVHERISDFCGVPSVRALIKSSINIYSSQVVAAPPTPAASQCENFEIHLPSFLSPGLQWQPALPRGRPPLLPGEEEWEMWGRHWDQEGRPLSNPQAEAEEHRRGGGTGRDGEEQQEIQVCWWGAGTPAAVALFLFFPPFLNLKFFSIQSHQTPRVVNSQIWIPLTWTVHCAWGEITLYSLINTSSLIPLYSIMILLHTVR